MTVIMATSRGPYSYDRGKNGVIRRDNVGGVATGLKNVLEKNGGEWICWGDGSLDPQFTDEDNGKYRIHRIILDPREKKGYYDDYSNSTLWPLFHYFREKILHDSKAYNYYRHVNRKFAEQIGKNLKDGDIIWVHDYQLSLVPGYLRDFGIGNKIIFTWHIPWVSSGFYSILPERNDIVRSIAQSDSITFHTDTYGKNFRDSYFRVIGKEKTLEKKIHTAPLGINYRYFSEKSYRAKKRPFPQEKIIFSIDRLDYTKGLVQRVNSIETLIKKFPDLKEKFVFIMVVTPSRSGVKDYDNLKDELEMNIGRINGMYGNIRWTPIIYMYRKISAAQLSNFYRWADIALITPLIDGLNLVAEEYVSSSENGILIISEFAGVARYLKDALLTNPNSGDDVAEKIRIAIEMDQEESRKRLMNMKDFIKRHDVGWWTKKVLQTVKD